MLETLAVLNNNKILWGVTMLLLNAGSRHVIGDLGKFHEKVLTNEIMKKVILFSMFFVATRDIIISFILCMVYIIVIDGILHEKRKFAIVHVKENPVSDVDYKKAKETISKYEAHQAAELQQEQGQSLYNTYLNNLNHLVSSV